MPLNHLAHPFLGTIFLQQRGILASQSIILTAQACQLRLVLPLIAGSGLFGRLRYMPGVSWYIFA
jgi:hypothetical protein